MRKIFTNLKSVVALALVAAMTLSVSCMYDDTALTKRVDKVEKNLAALTEKVNALDVDAVQSLINGLTVITGLTTDEAGNTVVTLSNGESFTVLAECAGLQYRTENGVLELSADGETWVAVTANASCLVKEVRTNADGTVTLVLADGTEFTGAVAELIECEATRSAVYVIPGDTKAVRFTVNDAVADINVMNQPFGWSATVEEYVEVEEPGYDDDFGILAVGGTEYVLNINAPSAELVDAGFAAKEGVVSVHFNTAAGACKVLKVDVTLAEVTLSVDKNGNVTISNSVAMWQEGYWGEKFFDFANFYFGIMPKSLYEQYGNNALIEDYDEDVYEFDTARFSQRGSGLNNVVDLPQYEEGVTEFETYTLTLAEFCSAFYPKFETVPGEEYILFVTLSEVMQNYTVFPDLSKATLVEYKSVVVDVAVDAESATANDVNLTLSLAGYNYFLVGAVAQSQIDEFIENGVINNVEEFYTIYLAGNFGGLNTNAGAIIPGVMGLETTYASLAQYSMTGYIPALDANTEYRLFVYPFNMESEMDLYTMEVNGADVYDFGTFETAGLVPGDFDAIAKYEVASMNVRNLVVNAYFNEDVEVAKFAYKWFEGPALDEPLRIADIIENSYFYTTDYNPYIEAEYYSPVYPAYLGVVVVNAAGEYVYEETVFEFVESYNFEVEYTSAEFVNGVLKFKGADANDYLEVIVNPGLTSIVAGEYTPMQPDWFNGGIIPWSSADALEYDGSNSKFNLSAIPSTYGYYLTEYGKMTVALEGDVYTIVVTDLGYIDYEYQPVKFTFTGKFGAAEEGGEEGGEDPEVTVLSATATRGTKGGDMNYHYVEFALSDGNKVGAEFRTDGNNYLTVGGYTDSYSNWTGGFFPGYINYAYKNGASVGFADARVDYADDAYTVMLRITENWSTFEEYTYTGAIEGLEAPAAAEEVVLPNTENLTLSLANFSKMTAYCDIAFVDADGKNALVLSLNDSPLRDCTYTVESSSADADDPGTMYLNGCYVEYNGYQKGTSATLKSGSVDVKLNDGVYTITVDLVLSNGQPYTGLFTGEIK